MAAQIADAIRGRQEAIDCRQDSHDPSEREFYTQHAVSAYFRILDLRAQLNDLQTKS